MHAVFWLGWGAMWCATGPAVAATDGLRGTLKTEFETHRTSASARGQDRWDSFLMLEGDLTAAIAQNWSLRAVAAVEPLTDPQPLEDRFLGNLDGRWKDVYLEYAEHTFGLRAGRISAPFGQAWWATPGIDATSLAEDYALWDRWGGAAWYRFAPVAAGRLTFSAAAFRIDTSVLSRSWRNTRHQRERGQGGPANTAGWRSWAIALDADQIPGWRDTTWHVALMKQETNHLPGVPLSRVADEQGVVASIQRGYTLRGWRISTLAEWARLWHRGGVEGRAANYLTLGQSHNLDAWTVQTSYSLRRLDAAASAADRDWLGAVTAGYALAPLWQLELGWRQLMVAGDGERQITLLLRHASRF